MTHTTSNLKESGDFLCRCETGTVWIGLHFPPQRPIGPHSLVTLLTKLWEWHNVLLLACRLLNGSSSRTDLPVPYFRPPPHTHTHSHSGGGCICTSAFFLKRGSAVILNVDSQASLQSALDVMHCFRAKYLLPVQENSETQCAPSHQNSEQELKQQ